MLQHIPEPYLSSSMEESEDESEHHKQGQQVELGSKGSCFQHHGQQSDGFKSNTGDQAESLSSANHL
jgi:hypothetical protein